MKTDNENPEWTDEQIAQARPASEVHAPAVAKALVAPPPERLQGEG